MSEVDSVIAALNAFVPSDNDVDNMHRLYQIFEGFRSQNGRERAAPAILALLERFPEANFGSPGPLVHELEAMSEYEPLLQESLRRQPTDLTVWMVNRILNANQSSQQRELWLSALIQAAQHPRSSKTAAQSALEFLSYQSA